MTGITKKQLQDHANLKLELIDEEARLNLLRRDAGIKGCEYTGMPHTTSISDPVPIIAEELAELEASVNKLKQQFKTERKEIDKCVNELLVDPTEKKIIKLKYYSVLSWPEIVEMQYGKYGNFIEKREKYEKRIYRIHGNALQHLNS